MIRMNDAMSKLWQLFGVLILLQVSVVACVAEPLTIAVASNATYAFDDLAAAFRNETGIKVKSVIASSGKLSAQIKSGSPFDVFLSADMAYPNSLYKDGLAMAAPKVYAKGLLVLWTMRPLDLGKGMQVLNDADVKKVAIASPEVAPYGREALKALEYLKLSASVKPKLVFGESIAQVNHYIDTESADIGFTAKSVVLAPELAGKGKWIEVPQDSYQPIAQGAVILRFGMLTNGKASHQFMEFLSSPEARSILEKYGYQLP